MAIEAEARAYDVVAPPAGALIESLRAFGYTPPTAVADLLDNSISAGASNIWLNFAWDGEDSYITLRDDGRGMNGDVLVQALRPGSRSPLAERALGDLGRFGLGLKTASFSQCRCVTVSSKAGSGVQDTHRWDLDYVGRTSEWRLLRGAAPGSEARLDLPVGSASGTVVLWERLDRIVGDVQVEDQRAHKRFLDMVDDVEKHLSMVFHRFMSRARGITIWINDRRVEPWDPFLVREDATQRLSETPLDLHGSRIMVTPYVLPHHSRLETATHQRAAGPRGWNAQQGFYVYRSDRLLLPGDWMGLGFQKEEHFKLARIAVDIPNSLDHEWDIDVRKSRARPPGQLRDDLRKIARATRERAAQVYRHRGKVLSRQAAESHVFVWQQQSRRGKISYRINRDHPLVARALSVAGTNSSAIRALLSLVEETIPVPLIVIENAERPDCHAAPFSETPPSELVSVGRQIYQAFQDQGSSSSQARERLLSMEPFVHFPELIAVLDGSSDLPHLDGPSSLKDVD